MRHHHGHPRIAIGGQGATAIEAEPTHPKHRRPSKHHGHIVRWHRGLRKTSSWPEIQGTHQGSSTGSDMHNGTSGKVQQAHLTKPAATPNPVGDRTINHHQPQGRKQQHRRKPHALSKRPDNQRGRDDRES